MKAKLSMDDNQLVFYTEKINAYLGQGLLSIAAIAAGSFVCYLANGETFLYFFGGFWIFCGFLISTNLIYIHRNLKNQGVATLLTVTHNGVAISPHFQLPKTTFTWSEISKIVLTKKLIVDGSDGGVQYSRHQAIIYLQTDRRMGILQRNKLGIEKSAEGYLYTSVKYPKDSPNVVIDALRKFSEGRVELAFYDEVVLNEPTAPELLS